MSHRRAALDRGSHCPLKLDDVRTRGAHQRERAPRDRSVSGHDCPWIQSFESSEGVEQRARAAIHDHGYSVLDQEIAGKQNTLGRQPDDEIAGRMRGTWVADHQCPTSQTKRISSNDRTIRGVRELETTHGIQADNPDPISDQRVFPILGCQHSAIRMRDDSGAEAAENYRPEMMVRMMMRKHDPFHRLLCDRADCAQKILSLAGTRQRIDDYDARVRHHKAGVRSSLGTSSRITDESVYAGCKKPERGLRGLWDRGPRERRRTESGTPTGLQRSHQ